MSAPWRLPFQILCDLFGGEVATLGRHAPAMLVGVSRTPKTQDEDDVELEDVVERLTDPSGLPPEHANLVETLGSRTFVSHPTDEGNETWLNHSQLVERIRDLQPITDPKSIFKTVLIKEDELELCNIVKEMQEQVDEVLNKGDYDSAEETLRDLFSIQAIESKHVDDLLSGVKDDLWERARVILREVMDAVMVGRVEDAESVLSRVSGFSEKLAGALPEGVDMTSLTRTMRKFADQQMQGYHKEKDLQEQIKQLERHRTDELGVRLCGERIPSKLAAWSSRGSVNAEIVACDDGDVDMLGDMPVEKICGKVLVFRHAEPSRQGTQRAVQEAKSAQAVGAVGIVIVGFSDEEIVSDHGRDIVGVEIPVMMVADESWWQELHDEDPGTHINFEGARCQA